MNRVYFENLRRKRFDKFTSIVRYSRFVFTSTNTPMNDRDVYNIRDHAYMKHMFRERICSINSAKIFRLTE